MLLFSNRDWLKWLRFNRNHIANDDNLSTNWNSTSYYADDDEFILHDDQLCAGLPHNSRQELNSKNNYVTAPGKDACQGDSGGPLICSIDDKAVLVGVVSHGSGCGEAGHPGIYAKVDYFGEWFQSGKFFKYYLIHWLLFFTSVLAEPTFVFLSNPISSVYNPMQKSFFGKIEILCLIYAYFILVKMLGIFHLP